MSDIFRSTDPLTFNQVDGIIVNESAPPANVQGVPANIAILVGRFQRGPENELKSVGSIGELQELFGKSSFSGNTEIKNKRWGSLRIIRALASDAAIGSITLDDIAAADALTFQSKYKGAYANNLQVKVEQASGSAKEVTLLTAVADSADSLDGTTFILQDKDGSVAFWIDTGDSGTTIPAEASAADRAVEITTIVTNDTADTVATKVAAAVNADAQFAASALTTLVTITDAAYGARDDADASTSGFTLAQSVVGLDTGRKYTFRDNNANSVLPDEVYDRVQITGKTQSQLEVLFAESRMLDPVLVALAIEPAPVAFTNLTSGTDGAIADTDYEEALEAAEVAGAGNVLFTDKYSATIKGYLELHAADTQDKLVVLAPDALTGTKDAAKSAAIADVELYRDTGGFLIYAFNPPKTIIDGVEIDTSPASWVASVISNIGAHIDPAFSANAQYTVGATGLKYALTRQDHIDLMAAGIAAFENDPDIGIKLRSGIVTQIADSSKRTIVRRRMATFLTNSIGVFLKNYQNAPNTAANRREAAGAITAFDDQLVRDGILPADSEVSSGLARLIDSEVLNTDLSIGQGFFKLLYQRRIFSSMRFIVLQAQIGETVVVTEGN